MRFAVVLVGACTAGAPTVTHAPQHAAAVPSTAAPTAVDPISAIASDSEPVSWLAPGPIQLELGAPPIEPASAEAIEVNILEDRGSVVRVAVRLEHARFAVWVDHARLLAIVGLDTRVDVGDPFTQGVEASLHRGAHVRRLAHKDGRTQIRYLGAVEIDGWVGDAAVGDRGPPRLPSYRVPTDRETLTVMQGAVIRTEPRWGASTLAVIADGWMVDKLSELEGGWFEVSYEDGDVRVHGFLSLHDPPGLIHRPRAPDASPAKITPTATVASGTCLYASEGGAPIGYMFGDASVELEPSRHGGWFAVTIESPWGPLALLARGVSATELSACAPAGAVPPPGPNAP